MRPRIFINCAMSADGKIALPSRKQTRISSDDDIARVHRLRNSCDAILVGIGTVLSDDPGLLVKAKYVKKVRLPLRVILDSRGRTPMNAKALSIASRTLIAVAGKARPKFIAGNVEVMAFGPGPRVSLPLLLDELGRRGIKKLLVEGGSETIWSFIKERFFDRISIYVGSLVLGGRGPAPAGGEGAATLDDAIPLKLVGTRKLGTGILLEWERGSDMAKKTPLFLCDHMLGSLARWLRFLGYDTLYPEPMDDTNVLRLATKEGRILLTRDKELAMRAGDRGFLVGSTVCAKQLKLVNDRFGLEPDPERQMSRCSLCNSVLEKIGKALAEGNVPPRVFEIHTEFWKCPGCGQYYWPGSHYHRIRHTIGELGK